MNVYPFISWNEFIHIFPKSSARIAEPQKYGPRRDGKVALVDPALAGRT